MKADQVRFVGAHSQDFSKQSSFFINKRTILTTYFVVPNNNEIYWSISLLSSDFGLLSERKFDS